VCALEGGIPIITPRDDPRISIVVPTLDEVESIAGLLEDLRGLAVPHEVLVADGGSTDATCTVARERGARVLAAPRGRGAQLRAGAAATTAPLLCFLHADVRLSAAALREIERLAERGSAGAYAFRLAIDRTGPAYRLVEWGANLRSAWGRLPYGDQGLLVQRADYDAAGGFPAVPLMEDVAFVRALQQVTRVRLLPVAIRVSARRWEQEGLLRRTWANWLLLGAYLLGTPPERLAHRYRPSGGAGPESGRRT
jgi:rSAM/selenodomain-associated transferase 2